MGLIKVNLPRPLPLTPPHTHPLQVNLFLAVLKVKFAKAQTIFMAKQVRRGGGGGGAS